MQSVVNYNGCCIDSDIRCLTNIHERSIIQTELYSPPLRPAVGKKQGMCAKSPDVWWSCTTRGQGKGDLLFVRFHIFRFWIQFFSMFYGIFVIYLLLMPLPQLLCIAHFLLHVLSFPLFLLNKKRVKVMADSHLIMLSNTVMRWALSPRRDCTTERFLGVSWEISGRIKNRPGGSGDSLGQRK